MRPTIILYVCLFLFTSCRKTDNSLNISASVQNNSVLTENPLLMHPLTASIQPRDSTMSTLYGNDTAFKYAQHHPDAAYPENAVLYEITWKQKPDEVWFGGNIPKEIFSVEKLSVTDNNYVYEKFTGNPLQKVGTGDEEEKLRRHFILSQRLAVSP